MVPRGARGTEMAKLGGIGERIVRRNLAKSETYFCSFLHVSEQSWFLKCLVEISQYTKNFKCWLF